MHPFLRRRFLAAALAAASVASLTLPSPAQAWWRGGVFIGLPPVIVGPPVIYAPPPVYYGPPPFYYAPPPGYVAPGYATPGFPPSGYPAPRSQAPQAFSAAPGSTCYAGAYTCPLGQGYPPGSTCACPTGHSQNAYGHAG